MNTSTAMLLSGGDFRRYLALLDKPEEPAKYPLFCICGWRGSHSQSRLMTHSIMLNPTTGNVWRGQGAFCPECGFLLFSTYQVDQEYELWRSQDNAQPQARALLSTLLPPVSWLMAR